MTHKHRGFSLTLGILFITALIITRVYNLENTARFIWDESSDLVNMHQIYEEKLITLIGPISETGEKVFGSLTYYMLLPFAILGNFTPVSPAYGAAFWGILTAILLLLLTYKINRKYIVMVAVLVLAWQPLIQTSRWAWNPNLIPFWTTLSLLFITYNSKPGHLLSGLSLGMSIHHHWLALYSTLAYWLVIFFDSLKGKSKLVIYFSIGLAVAILPFVMFDLTHPPGLFITRFMYFNYHEGPANILEVISNIAKSVNTASTYLAGQTMAVSLVIATLILLALDIKNRSLNIKYAFVWLVQLIAISVVQRPESHYFLPSLAFFFVWIISARKGKSETISKFLLVILIIGGVLTLKSNLLTKTWQTDTKAVENITTTIENEISTNNLQNVNITVLSSPDNNLYGRRYRDLMLIHGYTLRTKDEYQYTDNLFVISTSSEISVRKDEAYEMNNFRNGPLIDSWIIPNSDWFVYYLNRN